MPTPQREPLRKLSRSERTALERIVRRNNERVDVVRRANALLAVARTGVFIHAAHEAGLHSGTTVADLVARFNRHGLAALRIGTGRGRRATYSASERARIVATAQRQPNRRTDGTATWSLSTLQRSLRPVGLPRVGTSTIRRVLQDAGSSYQRTRTWCPTGTAQRKRKSGVVTVVDPNTEEKRGSSTWPITSPKRWASHCGARMRLARIKPCPSPVSPGSPRASRAASRTSTSAAERPSC